MKNSGKTPLLRARNIEKKLGIKRIYIKLEGANPSGSKKDRLAHRIVHSAMAQGKNHIVCDGSKSYLKAIKHYTEIYRLKLSVMQFKNQKWKNKLGDKVTYLDNTSERTPRSNVYYQKLIFDNNTYLAVENYNHLTLSEIAYSNIAEEIIEKMKKPADTIFYTHSDEYKSSLYNAYLKDFIAKGNQIPKMFSTLDKNISDENTDLLVDETLISQAYSLLTRLEHLKLKKREALPFAGFLLKLKEGKISKGHHVIVLDSAKTRVDIKKLESFDEISKEELLEYVDEYLEEYSDPKADAREALDNAIDQGYILVASHEGVVQGICVIVNVGFDKFIPTYHLAYIGTNSHNKGRGLGTELIEYAVDLADGKISLHVDLDNYRAKKLYEKMGFKHVYNRMIFQNED